MKKTKEQDTKGALLLQAYIMAVAVSALSLIMIVASLVYYYKVGRLSVLLECTVMALFILRLPPDIYIYQNDTQVSVSFPSPKAACVIDAILIVFQFFLLMSAIV